MNPQEKAEQLVQRNKDLFYNNCMVVTEKICIDLAKKTVKEVSNANPHSNPFNTVQVSTIIYWSEILKELNKM